MPISTREVIVLTFRDDKAHLLKRAGLLLPEGQEDRITAMIMNMTRDDARYALLREDMKLDFDDYFTDPYETHFGLIEECGENIVRGTSYDRGKETFYRQKPNNVTRYVRTERANDQGILIPRTMAAFYIPEPRAPFRAWAAYF